MNDRKYVSLEIVEKALVSQEESILIALMNVMNDTQTITGEDKMEFYRRQAHRLAEAVGAQCGYNAETIIPLTPSDWQQANEQLGRCHDEIEALRRIISDHIDDLEQFANEHSGTHAEKRGALNWITQRLRRAFFNAPHNWHKDLLKPDYVNVAPSDSEIPF